MKDAIVKKFKFEEENHKEKPLRGILNHFQPK